MMAFHNDPTVKEEYSARAHKFVKACDGLLGYGYCWKHGRDGAFAHTRQEPFYFSYERELGIPEVLGFLIGVIVENLPIDIAKQFPANVIASIRPGADLSKVWPQYAAWLLDDRTGGVIRFVDGRVMSVTRNKQIVDAICHVAQLLRDGCSDEKKWLDAEPIVREACIEAKGVALLSARVATLAIYSMSRSVEFARHTAQAAAGVGVAVATAPWAVEIDAREEMRFMEMFSKEPKVIHEMASWEVEVEALSVSATFYSYIKQSSKLLELLRAA